MYNHLKGKKTMIEKMYIDRLRQLPIEEVADALGMGIRWHKALCPFHDDSHPSLHFSRQHNTYHCYVCGEHGGPIDLVMKRENLNFHAACHWLADAFGVYIGEESGRYSDRGRAVNEASRRPSDRNSRRLAQLHRLMDEAVEARPSVVDTEYLSLYVSHPVLTAEAEHFLFEERKLRRAVIEWCHVSSISQPTPCTRFGRPFYDAPSLLIPYFDAEGRLLSVQSRYLGASQKASCDDNRKASCDDNRKASDDEERKASGVPRFRFPRGSQCHIYNLPILRWVSPGEPLFITEGCTDCWAMMSTGRKAIAIPSATLLKPEDIEPLKGLNLHICPDQDEPGERLYLELKDLLPQLVRHQLPEGCKDFSDYYLRITK